MNRENIWPFGMKIHIGYINSERFDFGRLTAGRGSHRRWWRNLIHIASRNFLSVDVCNKSIVERHIQLQVFDAIVDGELLTDEDGC